MKTDQITKKIDKLLQIAPWLPTPENLSSLMKNLSNHKNYTHAHECFYQWLGQCNKAKKTLEELLEHLEPLKKEQEEKLYNDLKRFDMWPRYGYTIDEVKKNELGLSEENKNETN